MPYFFFLLLRGGSPKLFSHPSATAPAPLSHFSTYWGQPVIFLFSVALRFLIAIQGSEQVNRNFYSWKRLGWSKIKCKKNFVHQHVYFFLGLWKHFRLMICQILTCELLSKQIHVRSTSALTFIQNCTFQNGCWFDCSEGECWMGTPANQMMQLVWHPDNRIKSEIKEQKKGTLSSATSKTKSTFSSRIT